MFFAARAHEFLQCVHGQGSDLRTCCVGANIKGQRLRKIGVGLERECAKGRTQ